MDRECICKLREIHRAIARMDEEFVRVFGIGLNEAMLLCTLGERGSASAGELSGELRLTRSNTSKVLSAVEGAGYVERKIGESDKRTMLFSLTPAGKECLGRIDCGCLSIPDSIESLLG